MSALLIVALSAAYGVIGLVVARLIAGHMAWRMMERKNEHDSRSYPSIHRDLVYPSGDHWVGATMMGLALGVVWPLTPLAFAHFPWAIGAEQRARLNSQEARIKELEKALELAS